MFSIRVAISEIKQVILLLIPASVAGMLLLTSGCNQESMDIAAPSTVAARQKNETHQTALTSGKANLIELSSTKNDRERKIVRELLGKEISEAESLPNADIVTIRIALEDLNDDKKQDMLVYLDQRPYFCGTAGCSFYILMANQSGQDWYPALRDLTTHENVRVSDRRTNGYREVVLEERVVWVWDGKKYIVKK